MNASSSASCIETMSVPGNRDGQTFLRWFLQEEGPCAVAKSYFFSDKRILFNAMYGDHVRAGEQGRTDFPHSGPGQEEGPGPVVKSYFFSDERVLFQVMDQDHLRAGEQGRLPGMPTG